MPSASLVESDPKNFGQIAILTEFKKLFSFLDEGYVLQLLGCFLNHKSRPILHLNNSKIPPFFGSVNSGSLFIFNPYDL